MNHTILELKASFQRRFLTLSMALLTILLFTACAAPGAESTPAPTDTPATAAEAPATDTPPPAAASVPATDTQAAAGQAVEVPLRPRWPKARPAHWTRRARRYV